MSIAYLILENGAVFKGRPFGYDGETVGELVFTTGMTGYLETLSDPAYCGQIVLQTFPLIGNYGVIPQDFGPGAVHLKAYIVRDWCQEPSNFRSEGNLDSFLRKMKTPGLFGIDTRTLTRALRENGVMNAMVSKTPELSAEQWAELRKYKITGALDAAFGAAAGATDAAAGAKSQSTNSDTQPTGDKKCGTTKARTPNRIFRVVVWDFGGANRLIQGLAEAGCTSEIRGYHADAFDVLESAPEGVVLTGGPGDPTENIRIIEKIKELCSKDIPILAVGLGHQMLALARGAKTEKLLFGHRGTNQPVRELASTRAFVTTQNHGYAVRADSLPEQAEVSYENINDGTCEGIVYKDIPAFSVQFDPTYDIFYKFAEMLGRRRVNATE